MVTEKTPLFSDKTRTTSDHQDWLTANDILRRTGIEKQDLIRFIQLQVLPKSMMRISRDGHGKGRKKSYFSPSILEQVNALKRLRDQGYTVETITGTFQDRSGTITVPTSPSPRETAATGHAPLRQTGSGAPRNVQLPAATFGAALFFVNTDLRIGWAKTEEKDLLSKAIANEMEDDPSGTVFDILLRASLKEFVFNWQPLFTFVYGFLKETTDPKIFHHLAPTISMGVKHTDQMETRGADSGLRGRIDSCPILLEGNDDRARQMRIYGLTLSDGTLFILSPEHHWDKHAGRSTRESGTDTRPNAEAKEEKVPFGVLSVRLDNSREIVEALLPDTYYQLMEKIWQACDQVLASHGGHRVKRSGNEVQYMLPKSTETDPVFEAICCAVELREKMRAIEADLRTNGGWFADIRLNMGISSGKDRIRPDDPTASMAFTLPGGAADQAYTLSAFAHEGGIWVTKSAFGHLTPDQIRRVTFGIYRENRLIPNIFAKLSELTDDFEPSPTQGGIHTLSITQIIAVEPEGRN